MSSRLQIQFLGLNEGDDPKNLPPGTMLRAENVQMPKPRTLAKRRATTGLVKTVLSGSNPAAGVRLLSNGTDTAITDGETAWTYASALSMWGPTDRPPSWRVTKRALADSMKSVGAMDVAIYGTMLISLYVTADSGLVCYLVTDAITGTVIVPPTGTTVGNASYPRVIVSGTSAYFFYSRASAVYIRELNLTTFALGAVSSLVSNATATATVFDAVIGTPTAGVPTIYLAYELAAGVNRTRIASFTLSTLAAVGTLDSLGTGLHSASIAFGDLAQRVSLVYSAFTSSKTTRLTSCTTALGSQVGPTQLEAVTSNYVFVAEFDASNLLVGWSRNSTNDDGSSYDRMQTSKWTVAAHVQDANSIRATYNVTGATKPWKTGSRWFVSVVSWVHTDTFPASTAQAQASTVILELETADSLTGVANATHPHVATLQNQTGWVASSGGQYKAAIDNDGIVWLASPYRNREPATFTLPSVTPIGWEVFRLAASTEDTFRSTTLGASALVAGGAPAWFDGATTMPYGFAHTPIIWYAAATAGGAMAIGTYSYVATYAWRDAKGVLHRSAPSPPVTGTTAGANLSLTVRIATSSISAKARTLSASQNASPVFVEVWRTTVGGTGDHYRLSFEPIYQPVSNDPRTGFVDLVDTKADGDIAGGAPAITLASQARLYTDLGELENIPPPSLITCTTHQGRLVGIGPDLRTVWFSKDSKIDTTVAPGFNEALTLAFAHDKTALASLDTTLVVFGEDKIDIVQGDGPDDAGNNNTWQIQAVQTDVGCVNPRSVVATPVGIMFESRRGLDLLDRGLTVTDILGRYIVDTLDVYPTITSAVLVAADNEVRFTCDDGVNGIVLAYDYLNKVWFTRKYTDASDTGATSVRFVDAALIDGVYTMLTAGGQVYRETSDDARDGGSAYVSTDVLLAPISAQPGRTGWSNDNLAWSRVKDLTFMGTSVAPHDLEVSFATNYSTTFGQTHTFAANATGTPTAVGPLEKARVTLVTQKCQAVQIRIRDLTPTGGSVTSTSSGPVLEALCLRVAAKDSPAKTTAGEQA